MNPKILPILLLAIYSLSPAHCLVIGGIDVNQEMLSRLTKCGAGAGGLTSNFQSILSSILPGNLGITQDLSVDKVTQPIGSIPRGYLYKSCISDPSPSTRLTSLLLTKEDVQAELKKCEPYFYMHVGLFTGCVYADDKQNKLLYPWLLVPSAYLLKQYTIPNSAVTLAPRNNLVGSIGNFGLPCIASQKDENALKLATMRQRCRKIYELVKTPKCNGDHLLALIRPTTSQQVLDCTMRSFSAPAWDASIAAMNSCLNEVDTSQLC